MKRLVLPDMIRIAAVILLLAAHIGQSLNHPIGQFFGIPGFYYVSLGGVAVTVFLVLSGFGLELQHKKETGYRDFLARRLLRIYPVYFMALAVGMALYVYEHLRTGQPVFDPLSLWDIPLSVSGCYAFAGKWGGPFLATGWFIGLIVSMYLVFPYISRWVRRKPLTALFLALGISACSRYFLGKYGFLPHRPLDWFPLCRVFEFTLGVFLVHGLNKNVCRAFDNLPETWSNILKHLSDLSFPLYLVHQPFLVFIPRWSAHGNGVLSAVLLFLFISLTLSSAFLVIDRLVPRKRILALL